MGTFDSLLTKYGAVMAGYTLLGIPIFSGSDRYSKQYQNDSSIITKDYIRNSGLLVSLAKSIGRIISSYKDMQNLAGYTQLVDELNTVIDDINEEKFKIANVDNSKIAEYTGGKVSILIYYITIII
jgi:ATP-binding cassette subfamily D (ALD) protein 3